MKKGYTQIELLLVVGILAILFFLGTVIFGNFVRKDQLLVETQKIKSLINEAKVKTIAGFSLGGEEGLNFGLYFTQDRYFLFPGLTYQPEDSRNQEFVLPDALQAITIALPSSSLVFEKVSGEVLNFDPLQNFIVLKDQHSGEERRIKVNQLGTVVIEEP